MKDDVELHTSRLILRPVRLEDVEPWSAMLVDPETMQFLGGPRSSYLIWLELRSLGGGWYLDGFSRFSVLEKESGRWVGWVGPLSPQGWPGPEVGWGIIRDRWGLGYATEAASASINWAFDHLGWTEVSHFIGSDNFRSQAVAQRLGSYKRGTSVVPSLGTESSVEIWGQSREQWKLSRSHSG